MDKDEEEQKTPFEEEWEQLPDEEYLPTPEGEPNETKFEEKEEEEEEEEEELEVMSIESSSEEKINNQLINNIQNNLQNKLFFPDKTSSFEIPSILINNENNLVLQQLTQQIQQQNECLIILYQKLITLKQLLNKEEPENNDINTENNDSSTIISKMNELIELLIEKLQDSSSPDLEPELQELTPTNFESIETIITSTNLHIQKLTCILELQSQTIATGSSDGSLLISKIDFIKKEWIKLIHEPKAHSDSIISLCEIQANTIVSASFDCSVKLWHFAENNLNLIKILTTFNEYCRKVISLTNNRFAVSCEDGLIQIWNSSQPYSLTNKIKENCGVNSMLQLSSNENLITSCPGNCTISFWNITLNTKVYLMKKVCAFYPNGMIELSNGNVAISHYDAPYPIKIVDPMRYAVVKEIINENYFPSCSSMCVWDEFSFIYVCNERFYQISTNDYEIIFKMRKINGLDGINGVITIKNGKYLAVINKNKGVTIIEPN